MLNIYITPRKHVGFTADGIPYEVSVVLAKTDNGYTDLNQIPSFTDVGDVEFYVKRFGIWFCLQMTPGIKKAVVHFLNKRHGKRDLGYDCYSFACQSSGVRRHEKLYLVSFWNLRTPNWIRRVGDVIFLTDNSIPFFYHAAIYIGFGLYIHVLGAGGQIEISTLCDMKRDFKAPDIVQAVPRYE